MMCQTKEPRAGQFLSPGCLPDPEKSRAKLEYPRRGAGASITEIEWHVQENG